MAQQPTSSVGIDNPWYPEGGPGRHLKTRLKRGDVLIGPMLQQFARPPLIKLFQHAGYDFVYIEYEHTSFDPEDLADILVPTPQGQHIPLGELAKIEFVEGPPMIKSENARLTGWVFVDIEDRDIGTYVKEAQKIVAEKVDLPAGYALIWSGQFEQMLEAAARMKIAVPAAIFIIFTLLMVHFGRLDRTLIIMLSLPFGLIGGVWALYLAGYNFSVAVGVGFIALAGIAVETAVVMLLYIDHQVREHPPKTKQDLLEDVIHGAVLRVRPKLMTVSVILAGLAPIFITEGLGSDVMRRIALPMVGGMITTTILTLIVIPVVYYIWEGRRFSLNQSKNEGESNHENA